MDAANTHPVEEPGPGRPLALVTGGSRGLGHATAAGLLGAGWDVLVTARDGDALAAAADGLRATPGGGDVVTVDGDVTDPAHHAALGRALGDRQLDLLVANASTLGPSPLPALREVSPDVLARVLAVNAIAPLTLVRSLRPWLRPGATVVAVTSDAAHAAWPGWGVYGASKAALEHLAGVLDAEEEDLRVLVVDPGDLRTRMHQEAFPGQDISDRPEPASVVPALLRLLADGTTTARRHVLQAVA